MSAAVCVSNEQLVCGARNIVPFAEVETKKYDYDSGYSDAEVAAPGRGLWSSRE